MITTATTATTVATATSATTMTAGTATTGLALQIVAPLGIFVVLLLIALLITKELSTASDHPRAKFLSRAVNVALLPLFAAFLTIAFSRLSAVFA